MLVQLHCTESKQTAGSLVHFISI